MNDLPSILTPDLGLLFWMFLAFLVVLLIVAKWGFPAIIGMVEKRKRYIDESLQKAHDASERLANIQKEGENMLQEARQKQAAISELRAQMAELSVKVAEKILRKELSSEAKQMETIDRLLDDISEVDKK